MANVRSRIERLEAQHGKMVEGRDPFLVRTIQDICERAGEPFDIRAVPIGMPAKVWIDGFISAVSGKSRGLPYQNRATGPNAGDAERFKRSAQGHSRDQEHNG